MFNIAADHVYLHSELDAHSRSPGVAFPAKRFNQDLDHAQR